MSFFEKEIKIKPLIIETLLHAAAQTYAWLSLRDIESSLSKIVDAVIKLEPTPKHIVVSVMVFVIVRILSWASKNQQRFESAERVIQAASFALILLGIILIGTLLYYSYTATPIGPYL